MAGYVERKAGNLTNQSVLFELVPRFFFPVADCAPLVLVFQGDFELAWEQMWHALPAGPETKPGDTLYGEPMDLIRNAFALTRDAADLNGPHIDSPIPGGNR